MATSDAERIAVNAAASSVPSGGGKDSALSQHYNSLHSALAMLSERTQVILEYCQEMEAGKTPLNHEVRAHRVYLFELALHRHVHYDVRLMSSLLKQPVGCGVGIHSAWMSYNQSSTQVRLAKRCSPCSGAENGARPAESDADDVFKRV